MDTGRTFFIPVILGTARMGRMSLHAARLVTGELGKCEGVESDLIDIAKLPLPTNSAPRAGGPGRPNPGGLGREGRGTQGEGGDNFSRRILPRQLFRGTGDIKNVWFQVEDDGGAYSPMVSDPLEAAWETIREKQFPSNCAKFAELAQELQRARPGQPIALPLTRIAELMNCHWTLVSRFRRRAESAGVLKLANHYVPHRRATQFYVDLEASLPSETLTNHLTSGLARHLLVRQCPSETPQIPPSETPAQVLRFAQGGFRLFPCKPREKTPAISNWPKRATCDAASLAQYFGEFPGCNWAVACGEESGVWVLDIDGDDGLRAALELRVNHDHIATLAQRTARGWHMFFRWPAVGGIRNSACRLAPGLDVRGEGGYALVPPSVHPSGVRYEWIVSGAEITPAPDWLLAMVTEPKRKSAVPVLREDATSFAFGCNVVRDKERVSFSE